MSQKSECVRVVVRCRIMLPQEIQDQRKCIVKVSSKNGEVVVENPKSDTSEPPKIFTFDATYEPLCQQESIYKQTAYPIVESVLKGYNGTIFAYGQTGTGKTHTMEGDAKPGNQGITPRTFEHVFNYIKGTPNVQFLVRASFMELYNEEIRDLLNKDNKKLEIREKPQTGVYIKDLSTFMIHNVDELKVKMQFGKEQRVTAQTDMNERSSRSHSIFTIIVETSEVESDGHTRITQGKLNLVDLAGSERQSKTHAQGDRLKEAININLSLTTLGNVISQLVDPHATHIPYRDSKLTRLLQDSLGGNTKTVMIANIGPADYNYDETISTLRYANRAKNIKNKPHINEDPKDALIRNFQDEINKLKEQLSQMMDGNGKPLSNEQVIQIEKIIQVHDTSKLNEMEEKIKKEKEEIKKRAEDERQKIINQKHMTEDEKQQLLKKLQEKSEISRQYQEKQEKMLKKIKKMEEKVIQGSAIMEDALRKERELQHAQNLIQEKLENERRMAEELKEKEMLSANLEIKYNNQKEEVADKTKRIAALEAKLKEQKTENKELEEMFNQEIEDLQQRRRAFTKELKLLNLILEYFIPAKYQEQLQRLAIYNQEQDTWYFPNQQLSGNELQVKGRKREQDLQIQQEIEEIKKMNLDSHINVYFTYTEDSIIREEELDPQIREEKQQQLQKLKSKKMKKQQQNKKEKQVQKQSAQSQKQSIASSDSQSHQTSVSTQAPKQQPAQSKQQQMEDNFPKARGLVQLKSRK